MNDKQPEALRLATYFDGFFISEEVNSLTASKTATELRRLHAENEVMLKALNDIAAWHDGEVGGHMDEPGSAKVAREAIQSISGDKAEGNRP